MAVINTPASDVYEELIDLFVSNACNQGQSPSDRDALDTDQPDVTGKDGADPHHTVVEGPVDPTLGRTSSSRAQHDQDIPVSPDVATPDALRASGDTADASTLRDKLVSSPARLPEFDLLVLSHLPVSVAPWISQAVSALARQDGATLLLRLGSRSADLELHEPDRETPHGRGLHTDITTEPDAQSGHYYNTSVATGAAWGNARQLLTSAHARRIIHASDPFEVLACPALAISRVIVLSGCDQAAVVAAYQTIKNLVANFDADQELGLVMAGAELSRAVDVSDKIIGAVHEFLGRSISLLAVVPAIQPLRCRRLRQSVVNSDTPLRWLESELRNPAISPESRGDNGGHESASRDEHIRTQRAASAPRVVRYEPSAVQSQGHTPAEQPTAAPIPGKDPGPSREGRKTTSKSSAQTAKLNPRPVTRPPPLHDARAAWAQQFSPPQPSAPSHGCPNISPDRRAEAPHGNLLGFLPGLTPLPVRCPDAPGVELGTDSSGRVHALSLDTGADPLADLMIACDWVDRHREVLAAIQTDPPTPVVVGSGTCIPHLFTGRAQARHRISSGRLKLHLLVQPSTARQSATAPGWYHLELN